MATGLKRRGCKYNSSAAPGPNVTVAGFGNNSGNVIESATSVNASNVFLGSSSSSDGNTTLTFFDGTVVRLVRVNDVSQIKFTQ